MNALPMLSKDSLLGEQASSVYRQLLLAHADFDTATICHYVSPPPLQERIPMSVYEEALIDEALTIRAATGVSFWEAVFCAALQSEECRDTVIEAALFHSGMGTCNLCHRTELESGLLESTVANDARNVGISSQVRLVSGELRHLLFLDFRCEVSVSNTELVHRVCRRLLPNGFVILDSGDSYHATSVALVTNEDRIRLLGKALLLSPIADPNYIAHQLQQDASSLRLSRGGKRRQFPMAVDVHLPDCRPV